MQKLETRNTYTPPGASQALGNCGSVIKHGHSDQVLQSLKTVSNNSDVNLPVSCGSGIELENIYCKNHTPIHPTIKAVGILGGMK